MVAANHLCVRIGKDGEGVTGFGGEIARGIGGVNADGNRTDAGGLKFGEKFFDAS